MNALGLVCQLTHLSTDFYLKLGLFTIPDTKPGFEFMIERLSTAGFCVFVLFFVTVCVCWYADDMQRKDCPTMQSIIEKEGLLTAGGKYIVCETS